MSTTGVDSPPSADVPQRGGFLGFLGTIPGILTAFAGVITALASLSYIASLSSQQPSVPDQPPVSEQQVPDVPVDPAPWRREQRPSRSRTTPCSAIRRTLC